MGWEAVNLTGDTRWRVTVGLAGASLLPELPWRLLISLVDRLADFLDVAAVGFIIVQSVAGSATVGLVVAWFLIGYLTYQYTPFLYPDEFEDVVAPAGFRALTALGTLYFGVIVWGKLAPDAVPIQVLTGSTEGETTVLLTFAVLTGMIGGGVLFGLYLARWHSEKMSGTQSNLTALMNQFFDPDPEEVDKLPSRWQSFYRWQRIASYSLFPPLICALVGLAGVILNLFYPIPEAALLVGLVVLRVQPFTDLAPARAPRHEVDLRLLDAISGATRNLKGMAMLVFSGFGMVISGGVFFVFVVDSFELFVDLIDSLSSSRDGEAVSSVPVLVEDVAVVTGMVAFLVMGVFSLVHWVRQLERIEPYAREWERSEGETGGPGDVSLPARPPGLLVPAHLPVVALALVVFNFPVLKESSRLAMGILVGLLTMTVVVMSWGLVWIWRHEPQSLTHESRDLLVTLLLQIGVYWVVLFVVNRQIATDQILAGVFAWFGMTCCIYVPEAIDWQSRQEGIRKLLGDVPLILAILSIVGFGRLSFEGSTLLAERILFVLAAVYVILTIFEIYTDWMT